MDGSPSLFFFQGGYFPIFDSNPAVNFSPCLNITETLYNVDINSIHKKRNFGTFFSTFRTDIEIILYDENEYKYGGIAHIHQIKNNIQKNCQSNKKKQKTSILLDKNMILKYAIVKYIMHRV